MAFMTLGISYAIHPINRTIEADIIKASLKNRPLEVEAKLAKKIGRSAQGRGGYEELGSG